MASPDRVRESMRLYAVTDRTWLGRRTLSDCVASAIAGGITCVQLREKQLAGQDLDALAASLKKLCAKANIPFLVNDDVACAMRVGADGVHVGQSDMGASAARQMLGPEAIVGVSVQTLAQAREAEAAGADYLGVGAMFATQTKPESAEVSIGELRKICRAVAVPVVAIGGLDEKTMPALRDTGISGVAVVSGLFAAEDIEGAARQLRACLDQEGVLSCGQY